MELRFRDHASFHRAAAGMTIGAALFGFALCSAGAALSSRLAGAAPIAGGVLGIATGAAIAYGRAAWRALAGVFAVALLLAWPTWGGLTAAGAVTALAFAIGVRGPRAIAMAVFGTAVAVLAMWTALRIAHAQRVQAWPLWAADTAAAGAMGLVAVLALLPRHLGASTDRVRAAIRALPPEIDADVRALCGRAVAIWESAAKQLDDRDPNLALVRDGVLAALDIAGKTCAGAAGAPNDAELGRRMADLDQRIAAATDDEVKAEYRAARAALADQRGYRDDQRQSRERLVARLHNHVAALEKLRLAAGRRAADAAEPVVDTASA